MKERLPLSLIRSVRIFATLAVFGLASACGSSSTTGPTDSGTPPGGAVITTPGLSFSPATLSVAPGATIVIRNTDSAAPHTVTSESAMGDYSPGAVDGVSFNSELVASNSSGSIVISSSAAVGTVIPFYCTVHTTMMGQGQITIVAP